jgi:hypothetical protein
MGDTGGMPYAEIAQDELAKIAGRVFLGSPTDDVPEKLWVDYWPGADQHYLRAIFSGQASGVVLLLLSEVARRIGKRYDVTLVSVAYSDKYTWAEVEQMVTKLHAVE